MKKPRLHIAGAKWECRAQVGAGCLLPETLFIDEGVMEIDILALNVSERTHTICKWLPKYDDSLPSGSPFDRQTVGCGTGGLAKY